MPNLTRGSIVGTWIVAIALLCGGCALRVAGTEHYVGPVLFRHAAPPEGGAYVSQVVSLGLLGEAGSQWGAALGVVDRVAVAPSSGSCEADGASRPVRWRRYGLPGTDLTAGAWHLSPFYLRGDDVPAPCFTRRATYGAAATAGAELNAFSIGVTSRTHMGPPADAITVLHFDDRRPLDTRLIVWTADPAATLPIATIIKEVSPPMQEVNP